MTNPLADGLNNCKIRKKTQKDLKRAQAKRGYRPGEQWRKAKKDVTGEL